MIPREDLLRVRRLASRVNPRIKDWAGLGDRGNRDRLGLTLAEGAKLVREGLASSSAGMFRPAALLVSDAGASREEAGELFAAAGALGVERYSLSDDCYAKVAELKNSDGLGLLLSFSREPADIDELLTRPESKWLAAAGVQDPGNAGALARTALAAGAAGCLFIGGADPTSPKFLRGGMGAAFRLPCLSVDEEEFASIVTRTGVRMVTAESGPEASDYRRVDYSSPMILLVGGERGVPERLAALASERAHIPLAGGVESLNLAVAAGIILFEANRNWSSSENVP